MVAAEGIVLLSLQTIVRLKEKASDPLEGSGRVRLVAQPGAVLLGHVAQQCARTMAGIGTDQLWVATLTSRDSH